MPSVCARHRTRTAHAARSSLVGTELAAASLSDDRVWRPYDTARSDIAPPLTLSNTSAS